MYGIPFPGLPKLLLSTTHLVNLELMDIPHSGYFSPDAMVAALSTLTSLERLWLTFQSPRSCPDPASRRSPPSTRSALPSFTHFTFKGASEYLEDLVACIDVPQLNTLHMHFFDDILFDAPQLARFISHTPVWKSLKNVYIHFSDRAAWVEFSSSATRFMEFNVDILCTGLARQISSVERICASCLPPLSILVNLCFYENSLLLQPNWEHSIENRQWLELLRPFMAVKNLYLSENFSSRIAPALQELVEGGTTEVLPALQNIYLKGLESSGSVQENIGRFVAARQVADHPPIGISPWADS